MLHDCCLFRFKCLLLESIINWYTYTNVCDQLNEKIISKVQNTVENQITRIYKQTFNFIGEICVHRTLIVV